MKDLFLRPPLLGAGGIGGLPRSICPLPFLGILEMPGYFAEVSRNVLVLLWRSTRNLATIPKTMLVRKWLTSWDRCSRIKHVMCFCFQFLFAGVLSCFWYQLWLRVTKGSNGPVDYPIISPMQISSLPQPPTKNPKLAMWWLSIAESSQNGPEYQVLNHTIVL